MRSRLRDSLALALEILRRLGESPSHLGRIGPSMQTLSFDQEAFVNLSSEGQ
jgi:hypothetical protein